jgi:hypothetical protein
MMSKETIEQMWEKFAEHQPFADELGYGEAWRRMCDERTEDAAWAAADAAGWAAVRAAAWAADAAMWAAWAAEAARWAADADAVCWAEQAISCINKAEGKK